MAYPTDGNEPGDESQHPDLTGLAGEMRAEWRAEQEAATADAAAVRRHTQVLTDWLRDRMHAGDRVVATVGGRSFVGLCEEVGADLLALRGADGRVEIQLSAGIPIGLEVVEHATEGGTRAVQRREFRDALLARDEQRAVRVGTMARPDGIEGTPLVSRDFVSIVSAGGLETIVPIAHIAWVTATT
jgi:hypothetical protein